MGNFLSALLKDGALAFIRHVLAGVGASLIGAGFATRADEQTWLGACMTAVGLTWSFYDKYAKARQLQTARALAAADGPPG
jgi:hypothetical protein